MKYGAWKECINTLKNEWIGKIVEYECEKYNVVDVDYNGILLIDKKSIHTDTTAVEISDVVYI